MMQFAVVGTLIGAILGLRFSVFALVPAMTGILVIAGLSAVIGGNAFQVSPLQLIVLLAVVQLGYLSVGGIRALLQTLDVRGRASCSFPEQP
jgi:hypothetical protein